MTSELLERLKEFSTCQIADALDNIKIKGHMPDIKLYSPDDECRIVGLAHTVQMVPSGGGKIPPLEKHHVDSSPSESIVVISVPPNVTTANWGGLMSTRAIAMNLKGVILDGRARDIEEHREMNFPVFAKAVSIHGSGGSTTASAVGVPINCSGVTVREGDIISADLNGVVVIPQERFEEVVVKIEELTKIEEQMMEALREGNPIGETFSKFRLY